MPQPHDPILESDLDGGVLVLTVTRRSLEGDQVAEELQRELLDLVERAEATKVVIDLSRAHYVTSIAFWPLLALRRRLQEKGGRMLICSLTPNVADVFRTTKLIGDPGEADAVFEVASDRAAAVARLAGLSPGN